MSSFQSSVMLRSALSSILRRGIVKPLQGQHAAAAYCTRVSESGELLSVGGAPLDPNDPEDMIGFFDMVGLFYEKAAQQLEPTLIDTLKGRDPVEVSVIVCPEEKSHILLRRKNEGTGVGFYEEFTICTLSISLWRF